MGWSLRSETSCLACRREARKSLISNEMAASPEMIAARCILAASILCYEGLLRSLYKRRNKLSRSRAAGCCGGVQLPRASTVHRREKFGERSGRRLDPASRNALFEAAAKFYYALCEGYATRTNFKRMRGYRTLSALQVVESNAG